MLQNTAMSLGDSLVNVWRGAIGVVPQIIIAVLVLALGFFIGGILGRLVFEVVKALKIDALLTKAGIKDTLAHANIHLNSGIFLGSIVKWFVSFAFLVSSLEIIGFTQVTNFLGGILAYIPVALTAGIIMVVTAIVANFLKELVSSSARVVKANGAQVAGKVVKTTVWVFGIIMSLQILGLPTSLFQIIITGIVAGLSIAFGLAFGLGGRDVAAKILQKTYEDMNK